MRQRFWWEFGFADSTATNREQSIRGQTFPLHFEILVYLSLDPLSDLAREGAGINSRHSREQGSLRGHRVYAGNKFA
jgi:hypothetical protein